MPRILRQLAPISIAISFTLLCLALKENFPFSHYPMYSNFEDQTYYVWLADREGKPIPSQTVTYMRLGKIKKVYNSGLLAVREDLGKKPGSKPRKRDLTIEQRRGPGVDTLRWIYENCHPEAQQYLRDASPIRLYQVDVRIDGNRVIEDPSELVGELSLGQPQSSAYYSNR